MKYMRRRGLRMFAVAALLPMMALAQSNAQANKPAGPQDATTQQVTNLVAPVYGPHGVAVDASGNVYFGGLLVGGGNTPVSSSVGEWNASTQQVSTLVSSGLNRPTSVAVDSSGNVYIADALNNAIKEWHASNESVTTRT